MTNDFSSEVDKIVTKAHNILGGSRESVMTTLGRQINSKTGPRQFYRWLNGQVPHNAEGILKILREVQLENIERAAPMEIQNNNPARGNPLDAEVKRLSDRVSLLESQVEQILGQRKEKKEGIVLKVPASLIRLQLEDL